jgi:hypothetical protein
MYGRDAVKTFVNIFYLAPGVEQAINNSPQETPASCEMLTWGLKPSIWDELLSDDKFLYFSQFNLSSAQIERNKTKEQLEEEKKISLSFRIKPLEIENLGVDKLRVKATELWEAIVKLETEKYDLEERQKRQDYDVGTTASA